MISGLVGATALTLVHQTMKKAMPGTAPHIDRFGRKIIARGMDKAGLPVPAKDNLQTMSLASDIVFNAASYSMIGLARRLPFLGGGVGGAIMGLGTLLLPNILGFGHRDRGTRPTTKAMTLAYYVIGGLAAAATYKLMDDDEE